MSTSPSVCPVCGGQKSPGTTTFSADIGTGVVVVRHVRATICQQCGEEWLDDATAKHLEDIVAEARRTRRQVEVSDMAILSA
ncbi:MAG: type II toxin-antitoxin system MqsA family antitoxin [Chloroflexi bacterium]|nr:type II toxin-antitoxin system MqsA family antitoxin [Chloroflexota bacterium]